MFYIYLGLIDFIVAVVKKNFLPSFTQCQTLSFD